MIKIRLDEDVKEVESYLTRTLDASIKEAKEKLEKEKKSVAEQVSHREHVCL